MTEQSEDEFIQDKEIEVSYKSDPELFMQYLAYDLDGALRDISGGEVDNTSLSTIARTVVMLANVGAGENVTIKVYEFKHVEDIDVSA